MIGFYGVGQIGGSLLLRTLEVVKDNVLAWDVQPITHPRVTFSDDFSAAELIVVSTPIAETIRALPSLVKHGAVVIDVMSVKRVAHVAAGFAPHFVGGHPMFGTEQSGFSVANPGSVQDALFVLTATEHTSQAARERAEQFVAMLGARPLWRTPEAHDQEIARVSHIPQLVASALALLAERNVDSWQLQGPAFRDMTRIAASPSDMWSEIIAHNTFVSPLIDELTELLHRRTLLPDARAAKEKAPLPHVSTLVDRVGESSTGSMLTRVMQLKAQGRDIAGLHVGEPQVEASADVAALAREALRTAPIVYTSTQGLAALRERVASTAASLTGHRYGAEDVIVTVGAKQAIHLALCSLLAPGEEVIIVAPAWVSFGELVKLAGGKPVFVKNLDHLPITQRTRAIILNTPNNPTGAVYSRQQLTSVLAAADKAGLWLLSDELYRSFVFSGTHVSPVSMYERSVFFDGISKSHAMTGLRVGYAAGPRDVIARMRRLASHETSCAPSVSQYAALALLDKYPDGDPALIAQVALRRQQVLDSGLRCQPDGAFYAWIAAPSGTAEKLLALDVAVMPGEAFGAPGFIRVAYATDERTLGRGLSAISSLLL